MLAFVQKDVEFERQQEEFKNRVGGSWEQGAFMGFFSDPHELALLVVQALNAHGQDQAGADAAPAAQARAAELAAGDRRARSSSNSVRVAVVPVGAPTVVDAMVLDDATVADRAAEIVRRHRLVPQTAGIETTISSDGLIMSASSPTEWHTASVMIAADGAVVTDLNARADGSMGSMAISYPRVEEAIAATAAVAQDLWALFPAAHRIPPGRRSRRHP